MGWAAVSELEVGSKSRTRTSITSFLSTILRDQCLFSPVGDKAGLGSCMVWECDDYTHSIVFPITLLVVFTNLFLKAILYSFLK